MCAGGNFLLLLSLVTKKWQKVSRNCIFLFQMDAIKNLKECLPKMNTISFSDTNLHMAIILFIKQGQPRESSGLGTPFLH